MKRVRTHHDSFIQTHFIFAAVAHDSVVTQRTEDSAPGDSMTLATNQNQRLSLQCTSTSIFMH